MNPTTSDPKLYFFFILLLCLPFIGTIVLHYLTKLLKFKRPSLKKSLLSILLSVGSYVFISVLVAILLHYFYGPDVEAGGASTFIVASVTFLTQTVAIKKFFKETTSRTIGVSVLTTLGIFLVVALFPLVYLVFIK